METETDSARRQLEALKGAKRAADAAAAAPMRLWQAPVMGLMGIIAAAVSVLTLDERDHDYSASQLNLILIGCVVLGVILALALVAMLRDERRRQVVRPKRGFGNGVVTRWSFVFTFSITSGLIFTINMITLSKWNPVGVAIGSFLWLSIVPFFAWQRHVQTLNNR